MTFISPVLTSKRKYDEQIRFSHCTAFIHPKTGFDGNAWADMIVNEKNLESPAWHETELKDREAALDAGKTTVSSWEEAKERIKKNVS